MGNHFQKRNLLGVRCWLDPDLQYLISTFSAQGRCVHAGSTLISTCGDEVGSRVFVTVALRSKTISSGYETFADWKLYLTRIDLIPIVGKCDPNSSKVLPLCRCATLPI